MTKDEVFHILYTGTVLYRYIGTAARELAARTGRGRVIAAPAHPRRVLLSSASPVDPQ